VGGANPILASKRKPGKDKSGNLLERLLISVEGLSARKPAVISTSENRTGE